MPEENIDANQPGASSTTEDANSGASSTSQQTGAKETKSMLDVLKQSFEKHTGEEVVETPAAEDEEEEQSRSSLEQDPEKAETEEQPEGESDDEAKTEEEEEVESEEDKKEKEEQAKAENERLDKLPRFQELNQKVKQMEAPANLGNAVIQYIKEHKIPQQTYEQGMDLMRMFCAGDAEGFLKGVAPLLEACRRHTGDILDDDIKAMVEASEMTEARAKEFQKLRNAQNRGKNMSEQQRQEALSREYNTAMNGWIGDKMRTNPDYKAKASAEQADGLFEITEAYYAKMAHTSPPRTPAEAVALAEKAYVEAQKLFAKKINPTPVKKKVLRSTNTGGGQKAKGDKPKGLADVLKATYDRHMADAE